MKKSILKKAVWLLPLGLIACESLSKGNVRKSFYEGRPCAEIKFKCLNQEKTMKMPSTPYVLTEKDYARIERHETLRMYREISQMLDIFYPGFWEGVSEEDKLTWMKQVHELAKKYSDASPSRGELDMMAHICSIIGVDFETNPKFQFVVNKFKKHRWGADDAESNIIDYLRFEVLRKDYSVSGSHYNTWSLRGVQENMPPFTRHVPDFYTEAKPYNAAEDVFEIYEKKTSGGAR